MHVPSVQEQARALHALGMVDYGEMKARLMLTTAALVAGGSTICWIHGDTGALLLPSALSADPGLTMTERTNPWEEQHSLYSIGQGTDFVKPLQTLASGLAGTTSVLRTTTQSFRRASCWLSVHMTHTRLPVL